MNQQITWDAAALTDTGLKRARNEDSHLFRPEKRLFAVADGMGGHQAGDVASRMAVDFVDAFFREAPAADADPQEVGRSLLDAAQHANQEILARGAAEPDKYGMGTTLTTLIALDGACVIGHIGDSRAYRLRNGALSQITTDHTWVQDQVALGALSRSEARRHPYANVLTRVLGMPDADGADVLLADVASGDLFLLCSDGLTSMIEHPDLEALVAQDKPLEQLAQQLVEAANVRGGHDNVTVILLRPVAA